LFAGVDGLLFLLRVAVAIADSNRLDAVRTTVVVQQKLMRHADIRTTMNTYGDVVTTESQEAAPKAQV